jgi:hypothetical protein
VEILEKLLEKFSPRVEILILESEIKSMKSDPNQAKRKIVERWWEKPERFSICYLWTGHLLDFIIFSFAFRIVSLDFENKTFLEFNGQPFIVRIVVFFNSKRER